MVLCMVNLKCRMLSTSTQISPCSGKSLTRSATWYKCRFWKHSLNPFFWFLTHYTVDTYFWAILYVYCNGGYCLHSLYKRCLSRVPYIFGGRGSRRFNTLFSVHSDQIFLLMVCLLVVSVIPVTVIWCSSVI